MKRLSLWKRLRERKGGGGDLGQILVEAAIALPIFFVLVFGTLEVGKIIFRRLQVSYAAFTVTRSAVVNDGQYIVEALRRISPRLDSSNVAVTPIYDPINDYYWVTLEYKGPGTYRTVRLVPDHTYPIIEAAGLPLGSSRNRHDSLTYLGRTTFPAQGGGTVSAVEYEMSRDIAGFAAWETQGDVAKGAKGPPTIPGNGVVRRWRPPDDRLVQFGAKGQANPKGASYVWRVNSMIATGMFGPQRNVSWGAVDRLKGFYSSPFLLGHLWATMKGNSGNPELMATIFPYLTGSMILQDPQNLMALFGMKGSPNYKGYPLARGNMGAAYGRGQGYDGYMWMYSWYGEPPVVKGVTKGSPWPWYYESHAKGANDEGLMYISGMGVSRCIAYDPKGHCILWDNQEPGPIGGFGYTKGPKGKGGPSQAWNFYMAAHYNAQQVEMVNNVANHPYTENIGHSKGDMYYVYDKGLKGSSTPWAPGQGRWETGMGCLDGPCNSNPTISQKGISNYDAHLRNDVQDEKPHGFHFKGCPEGPGDHTSASPGKGHC